MPIAHALQVTSNGLQTTPLFAWDQQTGGFEQGGFTVPTSERRILSSFPDNSVTVTSVEQLLEAVQNSNLGLISIEGFLSDVPSFRLSPHQEIRGLSMETSGLKFREGNDGIALSSDNAVSSLTLVTSPDRCAIWNDDSVIDLGSLSLFCRR
jgi:hypothetical protein